MITIIVLVIAQSKMKISLKKNPFRNKNDVSNNKPTKPTNPFY